MVVVKTKRLSLKQLPLERKLRLQASSHFADSSLLLHITLTVSDAHVNQTSLDVAFIVFSVVST